MRSENSQITNALLFFLQFQEQPITSPQRRLKSLDTFRGLSLFIMIFVNYGGGEFISIFRISSLLLIYERNYLNRNKNHSPNCNGSSLREDVYFIQLAHFDNKLCYIKWHFALQVNWPYLSILRGMV